jgi:D-serine deaminase-like pyridoxal phosphate-dependent protein
MIPSFVSAGGGRYFDRVAVVLGEKTQYKGHEVELIVRSGSYVVHDHGSYAKTSRLEGYGRL